MLTSQEFIERLRELGYKVIVNDDRIEIHKPFASAYLYTGAVAMGEHRYIFLDELPLETLLILTQYILTPFEKRGEVKVVYYRIPLPNLFTTDEQQQYITLKDGTYFASRFNKKLKQTFNEQELEDVPKFYKDFAVTIDEKEEIISD